MQRKALKSHINKDASDCSDFAVAKARYLASTPWGPPSGGILSQNENKDSKMNRVLLLVFLEASCYVFKTTSLFHHRYSLSC